MATIKVSALSPLNATDATFTYGITNANTEGKVAVGGAGDGLATLISPALTGTPTAPTPADEDSSTKIATTAFVYSNGPLSIASDPNPSTPTAGASISLTPYGAIAVWPINPAGTLATLTVNLGTLSAADGGNLVFVAFSQVITAITWGPNITATAGLALPSAIAANQTIGFVWSKGAGKWTRFL